MMLALKIFTVKESALSAILTMLVVFLWPSIPLEGVLNWLEFFYYYTPQNFLYGAMVILSGVYVGIYVYDKKMQRVCSVKNTKRGASTIFGGVLLGACPACIPVLAFFLPLSVTIYLSYLSWVFLALTMIFLTYSIWKMEGFKKPE